MHSFRKQQWFVVLLSVAVFAFLLAGCGQTPAAPAPTQPSAASQAPAAQAPAAQAPAAQAPAAKPAPKPVEIKPLKVTLAGYSAGGASAAVGQAIGQAITKLAAGSTFSYEPGKSGANEIKASMGEVPISLSSSLLVQAATKGEAPYEKKYDNLRGLAFLHTSDVQFIADKRSGITSINDLKTKPVRLATNTKNSFMEITMRAALQAAGTSYEDIEKRGGKVFFTSTGPAMDQMRNRQVDVLGMATLTPTTVFIELGNTVDLAVFALNDDQVKKTNEIIGSRSVVIPKDSYPFQTAELKSAGMDNILITNADLPEDTAYIVAKALYENLAAMQQVSVTLKQMTHQNMADVGRGVKLHPGAERFYREVGLIK